MPRKLAEEEILERIASSIVVGEGGCVLWTGRVAGGHEGSRYPVLGHRTYVHRFMWERANGREVPTELHVCHRCDNPLCVNPAHLFVGTNAENRHDSVAKRRHHRGETHNWATLTEATVLAIRADRRAGLPLKAIAAKYNVPFKTVDKIVYRVSWKHLP